MTFVQHLVIKLVRKVVISKIESAVHNSSKSPMFVYMLAYQTTINTGPSITFKLNLQI
jgi:hypothetical protein